jgi:hypothetical protein
MGNILVRYDNDIDKHLQFAMAGDVGLDLSLIHI